MLQVSRKARALDGRVGRSSLALGVFAASAAALPGELLGRGAAVDAHRRNSSSDPQAGWRRQRCGSRSIWGGVQPTEAVPLRLGRRRPAGRTAPRRAGIELLPFVVGAPSWAVHAAWVPGPTHRKAPAHLPASGAAATAWTDFLKAAVARYGPNGTFWAKTRRCRSTRSAPGRSGTRRTSSTSSRSPTRPNTASW